jgi:hypothetical protein
MIDEVDESVHECAVCSTDIETDDVVFTSYDSSIVCSDCCMICERCDEIGTTNDTFYEIDGRMMWCEPCAENRAYYCDSCSDYNSYGTNYITDRGESWCEGCTNDCYYCDDCDEWNADGCDSCAESSNRLIHDYNYRPDAIFHSTDKNERLFFGIEVEVEAGRNYELASEFAYRLEALDLAYLKSDGSLNHGFEIVTHPMSHDFFKNEAQELWDTLEQLRTNDPYKVKAWDTNTCGLHIHISRTGFSSGSHMHRFLNLVYSNQEFYEKLAGRSSEQWAKFSDIMRNDYVRDKDGRPIEDDHGFTRTVTTRTFKHKLGGYRGSDRYSAVNTNNSATLEMRIFRGSVNGDTIKAQLDLAHASVEYTRTINANDVINGALTADSFMWYIFQHEELYPHLVSRIDRLIPSVRLAEQNVSN